MLRGLLHHGDAGGREIPTEEHEEALSEYFRGYVDAGSQRWRYALRHPLLSARAFDHLLHLPRLTAELTDSVGGQAIWRGLVRERPMVPTPVHTAVTVLSLPETQPEYSLGKSKQTLRRKCRDAVSRGVTWALVTDPEEKLRLADLADERDCTHPREEYRTAGNANRALMVHPLWLVAYAGDGRPILVSITPTDGQWAILQYFRVMEDSLEASSARYLLTKVLAEHLIARGVRYLADNASPMGINNGLRHYQRMLGFRIVRVRPSRRAALRLVEAPVEDDGLPAGAASTDERGRILQYNGAASGTTRRQHDRSSREAVVETAHGLRPQRRPGPRGVDYADGGPGRASVS